MLFSVYIWCIADFDVEGNVDETSSEQPPLITATPVSYASTSLPTIAAVISNNNINAVAAGINNNNIQSPPLGRHPTSIPICPHCSAANITTRTSTYPSFETWIMCGVMVLIFWPGKSIRVLPLSEGIGGQSRLSSALTSYHK